MHTKISNVHNPNELRYIRCANFSEFILVGRKTSVIRRVLKCANYYGRALFSSGLNNVIHNGPDSMGPHPDTWINDLTIRGNEPVPDYAVKVKSAVTEGLLGDSST